MIRTFPNGETHFYGLPIRFRVRPEAGLADRSKVCWAEYIGSNKRTRGTETSQYLEERTSTETPKVVASEMGPGQCWCDIKANDLERSAIAGDSPVAVK